MSTDITKDTVTRIAKLARIAVPEGEKEALAEELSHILHWIEQLQEVDTEGVPQMTSVADQELPWRKDEVTDGDCREKVLQNAPKQEYDCFAVPKVIDQG